MGRVHPGLLRGPYRLRVGQRFHRKSRAMAPEWGVTFEGGTDGVGITIANSGGPSGLKAQFLTIGAGATATYRALSATGLQTMGARFQTTGTAARADFEVTATQHGWQVWRDGHPAFVRMRFRVPALPAASVRFCVFTDTPGAFLGEWQLLSTGAIRCIGSSGTLTTSSTLYAAGELIDVGMGLLAVNATAGQLQTVQFDAADPSARSIREIQTSAATQNTLQSGGSFGVDFGIRANLANFIVDVGQVFGSRVFYPVPPTVSPAAPPPALSGEADTTQHSATDSTGTRTASGDTAVVTRAVVQATGVRPVAAPATSGQRSAVTATGRKQATAAGTSIAHPATAAIGAAGAVVGAATTVQRSSTATSGRKQPAAGAASTARASTGTTGRKQAASGAAAVGRPAVAGTGRKQATGAGLSPVRPVTRGETAPIIGGPAAASARPATASTGKAAKAGAGTAHPHPATSATGKHAAAGAGTAITHPTTSATGAHRAAAAANSVARAHTQSTGVNVPAFIPAYVGLDGSTTAGGTDGLLYAAILEGGMAGSNLDVGTVGGSTDGTLVAAGMVDE